MKYETNFVKSMKFDVKYFRIRYTFIPVLKLITISQRKRSQTRRLGRRVDEVGRHVELET